MSAQVLNVIADALVDGSVKLVQANVQKALDEGIPAREILDNGLLAGMDVVSEQFKEGEMFVPEVLVSAKAMQAGVDMIKPMLVAAGAKSSAKILTFTVEGDLHDIGIKLVGMMLEGAGFEVVNIGVDVPAAKVVEKVKEIKPDIVGMAAMLTTTMPSMKDVVDAMKEAGLTSKIHIMVGGAPLSSDFATKIGASYAADANAAVTLAKELLAVTC